jgi:signal peptidase II
MHKNKIIRKNILIVSVLVTLILVLDQIIKVYIKTTFYPGQESPLLGNWFVLEYTENPGMAFGTTFGNKGWHKLALSIFRIIAITLLVYYWITQLKKGAKRLFLISIAFIIAGATGNLIDSMFYDFAFPYDPCFPYNHREGSGIIADCGFWGKTETRPHGFLMGNVVDMFKFNAFWPIWMPWLGGSEVFPAIWNVADGSISVGVFLIFIRQKSFFTNPNENFNDSETVLESKETVSEEVDPNESEDSIEKTK